MRGRCLFILLLLLAGRNPVSRWAWAGELTVDLTESFPLSCRSQGHTSSCHTFASIALLESALKRKYDEEFRLSEADLFVRKNLVAGNFQVVSEDSEKGTSVDVADVETGHPYKDVKFALENGVAQQKTVPWDKFLEAYGKFKAERRELCLKAFKEDGKPLAQCLKDRGNFRAFLDSLKDKKNLAEKEKRLIGEGKDFSKDRRFIWEKLQGLSVEKKDGFELLGPPEADDKGVCREKGSRRGEMILEHLNAKRPVVVCFVYDGLEAWHRKTKKGKASHCVAIRGYEKAEKERPLRLATRNSWVTVVESFGIGHEPVVIFPKTVPDNPDIFDYEFCRIYEIVAIKP